MKQVDQRAALDALIREKGEDYASLSRLIGRNAAYIQQFIRRGVPKKLDEEDRRTLAKYFGVGEEKLGGPALPPSVIAHPTTKLRVRGGADLVLVQRLQIGASAGPGANVDDEQSDEHVPFRADWLRSLIGGNPTALSIIQVDGDSMVPTLNNGDEILVDRGDAAERLRDGIYVLRIDDVLIVKRLAVNPAGRRFTIRSDNPHYPDWVDCNPDKVGVIGRVVWAGRKVG